METATERLIAKKIKALPPSFVPGILKATQNPSVISFAGGMPSALAFPLEALDASMSRVVSAYGTKLFQYSVTQGIPELRALIAERYSRRCGIEITPDEVLITTGSQQALDLLGKITLDEGDGVIVEEPGYLGALRTFAHYAPTFYPVTLSEDGLDLEALSAALAKPNVKLLYGVPDFQNPTGLTYSAENRTAIRALLKGTNTLLIEDDPYGELRFEGAPLPYIGIGHLEQSVLLGTFSKTVSPGMRVGFLITKNAELMHFIADAKESADVHTNALAQYILYDYLTHNDFEQHLASIRTIYKSLCETMLDAIATSFPADVAYTRPEGGMFIWCTLPEGRNTLDVFHKAVEGNVAFAPGDPFYTAPEAVRTFRLSYSNASPEAIRTGIARLGALL